ncbi:MAG: bifunctional adenosylcobinamide kinase/adenosylcobinamide-phosphate guanylyltransferase [Bacteroides sp.]|nr:bifunctional adenosylcobinamide kinase/adenosylcobinamide-phosphate guanylyltransferase [Bacteroides sp.]
MEREQWKGDGQKGVKVIMVTGGQRSGKSVFAEKFALELSDRPIYLATARVFDSEMQQRVDIHKERRKERWVNLESPLYIAENEFSDRDVVLLDCLTLLATNWFFEMKESSSTALSKLKNQLEKVFSSGATFIVVTNEVGLGGISANAMQRHFADLQGAINQYVAGLAEEVYMIISGIPVKIK